MSSGVLCIALDIEYNGLHGIDDAIDSFKNNRLEGSFFSIENAITTNMYNDGWSGTSSPTVVDSILYSPKKTGMDNWVGYTEIVPIDSSIKIVMAQGTGGVYVSFDLAQNKIFIHESWNGTKGVVPNVLIEGIIPFAVTAGKEYVLTIEKNTVKTLIATISNKLTTEKFTLTHITTGDNNTHGDGVGCIGLIHKSGSYTRKKLSMSTPQKTRPQLMIYGDSFIAGYNLIRYGFDINNRYAQLIKNALNGDVSISAKGGEDTWGLLEKINTDFQLIKPKYTLLAIGLNDDLLSTSTFSQFKVNMTKLINTIKNTGSIPILVTYPRLNGSGLAANYNSWIKNYIGVKYVDIQSVTSIDGTSGSVPNTAALFLADGHPNIEGNLRIFNRFKLDVPELFYE